MGDLPTPHPGCGQEVSTSSEKTQVLCLIKKVAVAHACLQKATVAVTFLKEVKFFLISGLLEEVGLRSCCRVEQPAELRCTEGGKIKEGSIHRGSTGCFLRKRGRCQGTVGVWEKVSLETGHCWVGTGTSGSVSFLFPLCSFPKLPFGCSLHPDFFTSPGWCSPSPEALSF